MIGGCGGGGSGAGMRFEVQADASGFGANACTFDNKQATVRECKKFYS